MNRIVMPMLAFGLLIACVQSGCASEVNPSEKKVVADVEKLGGFVERDEKSPDKPVIGISLKGTRATNEALEQLTELKNLQSLDLTNTKVTDAGLRHLEELIELRNLNLSGTRVTSPGLKHLRGLTKLEYLDVRHTKVISVKDIRKALPDCAVVISK